MLPYLHNIIVTDWLMTVATNDDTEVMSSEKRNFGV